MPISYFMTKENIIEFSEEDYLDDIREIMASKRHRDFPILDSDGKYIGMISRRNLLGAKGKSIILVDHNEKSQAVEGMEAPISARSSTTIVSELLRPCPRYSSETSP